MRLCVCGGRKYFNTIKVYDTLDYCWKRMPFVLLTGGATGADTLAARWAKEHNVPCEVYPANWQLHGRAAGFVRNVEMIKTGIDMLIAFPGGTGTAHMMIACLKHGIKVVKIEDEGEIGSSPVYFEESLK